MDLNFSLIKQNPVATGGIILVGGFLVWLVFLRSGTDTGAVASADEAFNPAAAQADLAARTIQADLTKAQLSASTQLAITDRQAQLQLALAKEQGAASVAAANTAAEVSLAQIASSERVSVSDTMARLEANRQATEIQLRTVDAGVTNFLAGTAAQLALGQASLQTTQAIADINASVQKYQIAATQAVQTAMIKQQAKQSQFSMIGNLAGIALGKFF
jgi:hypothetical protein